MEGLLPPFVEPFGPKVDDFTVVRAFARAEPSGYSDRFHAEGPALLADREVPAALRVSTEAFLVRLDLPDGMDAIRPIVETGLGAEGMMLLDSESVLGIPVALQFVGLRLSSWDLWGRDLDLAFAALRVAAAGEWA